MALNYREMKNQLTSQPFGTNFKADQIGSRLLQLLNKQSSTI